MPGQDIRIAASEGGAFDCYLALPGTGAGPAVIVMASVFGVDDEEWGQRLVGVFAGDIEPADLIEWAHGLLPTHMVPRSMRRVGEVPMLSIGKPDRRAVMRSDFGMYD